MSPSPLAVVVLAAGAGTRMNSTLPKVLHPLAGVPLIGHVLATAEALNPETLVVVVRHEAAQVEAVVADLSDEARIAHQDDIPGTGRAVEVALEHIPDTVGEVVIVSADVPLLDSATLEALVSLHRDSRAGVTLLSTVLDDPTGYGRIVRRVDGSVEAIVEQADASEEQQALSEVNAGVYVCDRAVLARTLPTLSTDNAQSEKYLTDVVRALADDGSVQAVIVEDSWLVEGVNDRIQLSAMQRNLNQMIIRGWQKDGVSIPDPDSVWIDLSVTLASDVTLLPGVQLHGACVIDEGATIGPDSTLTDSRVGAAASVRRTEATSAVIAPGATVGPFSYLRPGTVIDEGGKVGAFVETKNAHIGPGAKVPHLSYIGDADIGEGANIGAGSITANYDGVNKHRTVVGPHARTGSDNVFVAPVEIGAGAYTAAGTTIRRNVPAGALAVAPVSVRTIEGWVASNRPGSASDQAATNHPTSPDSQ